MAPIARSSDEEISMRSPLKFTPAIATLALAFPAAAQESAPPAPQEPDYFEALKACQSIEEDAARLVCFDRAVGSIVTASNSGDVQIIDKQEVEKTRRSLFGFSLPKLGIFGNKDNQSDDEQKRNNLLETTITSVHYSKSDEIFFVTQEGATWRISNVPSRLRTVKVGQPVVFKKAAMGSFFIRINGQTGVKGRRIR
jgi:hypothetical protein